MGFERTQTYAADVDRAMEYFASAEMTKARYEERGETDVEVLEATRTDDGGARIVTRRVTEVDLPGFAKKVLGATNTLEQTDVWTPVEDGDGYDGQWSLEVKGAPVHTGGTMRLRPEGDGCVYTVTGNVEVKVPLVGGKVAGFLEDRAKKLLEREQRFNAEHLD